MRRAPSAVTIDEFKLESVIARLRRQMRALTTITYEPALSNPPVDLSDLGQARHVGPVIFTL